jgi:hypothetical protein
MYFIYFNSYICNVYHNRYIYNIDYIYYIHHPVHTKTARGAASDGLPVQ